MEEWKLSCPDVATASRSLWSFKGNQQFSDTLDNIRGEEIEIEFESNGQAVIHINQTQFFLKLADVDYFDVFRTKADSVLEFLGSANGRYTISNISYHQSTKQTLNSNSRYSSNQNEKKRTITQINDQVNPIEDVEENHDIANDFNSVNAKRPKKQAIKKTEKKSMQLIHPPEQPDIKHESLQIKFVPSSVDISIANILAFFSGLKVHQVYVTVQSNDQKATNRSSPINTDIPSNVSVTVYISFDSLNGVELGYLRSGEVLNYQEQVGEKRNQQQSVQLYPVTRLESIWVEATALPLHGINWEFESFDSSSRSMKSNQLSLRTVLANVPTIFLDGKEPHPSPQTIPWHLLPSFFTHPLQESGYWYEQYQQLCTTRHTSTYRESFAIILLQTYKTMLHESSMENIWKTYLPTTDPPLEDSLATATTEREEESIEWLCEKIALIVDQLHSYVGRYHLLSISTSMKNYDYWMNYLQRRKRLYEVLFYRVWKIHILSKI